MDKPQSIQEFVEKHIEHIDLIRQSIAVYEEWRAYKRNYFCAVCDKGFTPEDMALRSPNNFNFCCKEHQQYASAFQIDMVRKKLGCVESPYYMKF